MAITDELRGFFEGADGYELWCPRHKVELADIADRIDAAHESEVTKAGLHGYSMELQRVVNNYIKLPTDADGMSIHVGDRVYADHQLDQLSSGDVNCIQLRDDGWYVMLDADHREFGFYRPTDLHHHAPTVEDVLREFAREIDADAYGITDAKVAEFAAKLRLAGEGE